MCPYGPTPNDWNPMAAEQNIDVERVALLPCPFCGGTDIAHETFAEDDSRDFVMCNGCGVYAQRNDCDAEPVEVWNRRTPSASIGEDGLPELDEHRVIELWNSTESGGMVGRYVRFANVVARAAVAADRRARANSPGIPDGSPQAAQGVKTWQGDMLEQAWNLGLHADHRAYADLRAQLACKSQGEPVAAMTDKGRFIKWNPVYAQEPWVSSGYRPLAFIDAAPPLSSEQQAEKGESNVG